MQDEGQEFSSLLDDIENQNIAPIQESYQQILKKFGSVGIRAWKNILNDLSIQYSIDLSPILNELKSQSNDEYLLCSHFPIEHILEIIKNYCKAKLMEQPKRSPPKIGSRSSIRKASERYIESDIDEKFALENPEFQHKKNFDEFERRCNLNEAWLNSVISNISPYEIFDELLSRCKINATLNQIKGFKEQLQNYIKKENPSFDYEPFIMPEIDKMLENEEKLENEGKNAKGKPKIDNVSSEDFIKLIKNWFKFENPELLPYSKNPPSKQSLQPSFASKLSEYSTSPINMSQNTTQPLDFQQKLIQTISEYEILRAQKIQNNEDVSIIDNLIGTLRNQLKKAPSTSKSKGGRPFDERCLSGLHEIFSYYAIQQKLLGKTPTFDAIQKNSETLNIGKYLKFCRDFGVMDKHRSSEKKFITQQTVKKIFAKYSVLQKEMDEPNFVQSLILMAQFYFDAEYDKIYGTNYNSLTPDEKKIQFFEVIGCHDPQIFSQKLKGFLRPFDSEVPTRLPENDISKRYKHQPLKTQQQKQMVEEWKKQKDTERKHQQSSIIEKPSRIKISSCEPAPADAIATVHQAPAPEGYKNKMIKKNETVTWKGLGEMTVNDLLKDEEFNYDTLIADSNDSGDEFLKKQYPLPKSQSQAVLEINPKISYKKEIIQNHNEARHLKSLTNQTLQRADELLEAARKSEDNRMQRGLKLVDARMNRMNQYAAKLRKGN